MTLDPYEDDRFAESWGGGAGCLVAAIVALAFVGLLVFLWSLL